MNAKATMPRRKRPFGVTIIALVQALSTLLVAAFVVVERGGDFTIHDRGLSAAGVGLILVGLVIAVGLWRLKRWAWVCVMLWTGLELAASLVTYFRGAPDYLSMISGIIIVFYLNQADVQAAFTTRRSTSAA